MLALNPVPILERGPETVADRRSEMIPGTPRSIARFRAGSMIALISVLALYGGVRSFAQGTEWTVDREARLGAEVAHPAGWTVRSAGYSLVVQSEDRASLVVVEAFKASRGETADSHVRGLPAS